MDFDIGKYLNLQPYAKLDNFIRTCQVPIFLIFILNSTSYN